MYKAITTKYLGPTQRRPGRIVAVTSHHKERKSVTVSWDHAISSELNHRSAAYMLADKLSWYDKNWGFIYGCLLPGSKPPVHVWVFVPHAEATEHIFAGREDSCV